MTEIHNKCRDPLPHLWHQPNGTTNYRQLNILFRYPVRGYFSVSRIVTTKDPVGLINYVTNL